MREGKCNLQSIMQKVLKNMLFAILACIHTKRLKSSSLEAHGRIDFLKTRSTQIATFTIKTFLLKSRELLTVHDLVFNTLFQSTYKLKRFEQIAGKRNKKKEKKMLHFFQSAY